MDARRSVSSWNATGLLAPALAGNTLWAVVDKDARGGGEHADHPRTRHHSRLQPPVRAVHRRVVFQRRDRRLPGTTRRRDRVGQRREHAVAQPGRHHAIVWPLVQGLWAKALAGQGDQNGTTGVVDGGYQRLSDTVKFHWGPEPDRAWPATAFLDVVHTGLFGLG